MNSAIIQLLVLAAVAIFLILKLKNVLGTRDGFEKPLARDDHSQLRPERRGPDMGAVVDGVDRDIADHVPKGSDAAEALAQMKGVEPEFSVGEFLQGAKGAYEMILMAFERGDIEQVRGFLSPEVAASFDAAIEDRKARGLTIEAQFRGLRDITLTGAEFNPANREAELTLRFVGDLTTIVRDSNGEIVQGSKEEIKTERDSWTFARIMGAGDPNWTLVATGD